MALKIEAGPHLQCINVVINKQEEGKIYVQDTNLLFQYLVTTAKNKLLSTIRKI